MPPARRGGMRHGDPGRSSSAVGVCCGTRPDCAAEEPAALLAAELLDGERPVADVHADSRSATPRAANVRNMNVRLVSGRTPGGFGATCTKMCHDSLPRTAVGPGDFSAVARSGWARGRRGSCRRCGHRSVTTARRGTQHRQPRRLNVFAPGAHPLRRARGLAIRAGMHPQLAAGETRKIQAELADAAAWWRCSTAPNMQTAPSCIGRSA